MTPPPSVDGMPRIVLRAEGGTIFGVALLLYAITGASWGLMLALFLAPDLSLLAYLAGPRAGSIGYNLTHTLIAPALLIAVGLLWPVPGLFAPALIWTAHIGFDRLLGY